jgi:hypothetical protein
MTSEAKQPIQVVLAIAIAVTAVRAGYIIYDRHQQATEVKKEPAPLNPDYLVYPRKLRPYDLKSVQQLTQQPVWVREGYHYTYFPYDAARKRSNFSLEAGALLPIEKLDIKDVVLDATPGSPDQHQVMAVFEKEGKTFAFAIGSEKGGDFQIYSDDMLFIQDPHELYKHWSPDMWSAIDRHEIKQGMNEIQADFAIGMGIPEGSGQSLDKTVDYPNGGKPSKIVYRNGKVAEINPGS